MIGLLMGKRAKGVAVMAITYRPKAALKKAGLIEERNSR